MKRSLRNRETSSSVFKKNYHFYYYLKRSLATHCRLSGRNQMHRTSFRIFRELIFRVKAASRLHRVRVRARDFRAVNSRQLLIYHTVTSKQYARIGYAVLSNLLTRFNERSVFAVSFDAIVREPNALFGNRSKTVNSFTIYGCSKLIEE